MYRVTLSRRHTALISATFDDGWSDQHNTMQTTHRWRTCPMLRKERGDWTR